MDPRACVHEVKTMDETHLHQLKQFLMMLSPGRIPPDAEDELILRLKNSWDIFNRSPSGDIEAYKLERMENPWWKPPYLTFTIERHGGMALGSTRAETQKWTIDIDRRETAVDVIGYRQLKERQPPVNVKPIAEELSKLILSESSDERLKWSVDGRVQVLTGKIFPMLKSPKKTVLGRRKRLLKVLGELLAHHGWKRKGSWWEHSRTRKGDE